jgi:AraC family transcriptional regulator
MKRHLFAAPHLAVAVCRYQPGERHKPHADVHSRISLLLRGGYREEGRLVTITMSPGDVLLKSRRAVHEDAFSDEGATLVALEFLDGDPFEASSGGAMWRRRADGFALRHATAILHAAIAGDSNTAAAAGADLIAACQDDDARRRKPPAWINDLKRDLDDESLANVNVAARARAAGAHPAHASRLFRQCYGQSISEYAQGQSVRRALGRLAGAETTLSEVALSAGFYDQSHMSRVFRRVLGRTPGVQRALIAAAC